MEDYYQELILNMQNLVIAKVRGEYRIQDKGKTEIDSKL